MEYVNEVKLCGKVTREPEFSHEFNGTPIYSIDVETTRINNKNNPVVALVRTYFTDSMLASGDIKSGVFISIDGKLVNSKSKGMVDISVLANSYKIISKDEVETSTVTLIGDITKTFTNSDNYKGFVNFVVAELDNDGKKVFSTRVVAWNRLADYIYNNAKIGDHVIIKGCISNSKTTSRPDPKSDPVEVVVSEVMVTYFSIRNEDKK
jgi:single-stranded DNA-binding protein